MSERDELARIEQIRKSLAQKPSLRRWYQEAYQSYTECLKRCPQSGIALELGSGAGFAKTQEPALLTSDILPCEGVDQLVDATKMPFQDGALRFVGMMNVLHHVPAVDKMFAELSRCLMTGGRVLIVDQFPGLIAWPLLRYFHREPFDANVLDWRFQSSGPLTGANGALAWIIFHRDAERFARSYPKLKIRRIHYHSPLRYWLCGGSRKWNFLPESLFKAATFLDRAMVRVCRRTASFMTIEIEKVG